MILSMDEEKFGALSIDAIGSACFAPMIPAYQEGMRGRGAREAAEFQARFYASLSLGQRALFMFFTYYDHAIRSEDALLRISRHYLSSRIFGLVKRSAEYFGDSAMFGLLTRIEQASESAEISAAYRQLQEIAPRSLAMIGTRVKENPAEFVCLVSCGESS